MAAVIFDLDGTLVDSAPDLHGAANKMLAELNLAPLPLETIISFIGNGVPKLVERCLRVYDVAPNEAAINSFRTHYAADPFTLTKPYPGVVQCLEILKEGGVKMGVCTNKPEAPARVILDGMNLTRFFDVIVGGDTYEAMKPDPAPLLGCAIQLRGQDELYVGDSETDELTAKNAGLPFALFSGGYRKTPTSKMQHEFLFDDFAALGRFVLQAG